MFRFSFHSFFYSKVGGGGLSKNLVVQDVLPRICCVFLMNTYDDVFGVSTKKSEQVGGGQRGSAFRFWRRRKNWRMLQGKANPIALACRDLTSFFFLLLFFYSAAGAASPASASSVAASDVQRVKLSRRSCMINVESL